MKTLYITGNKNNIIYLKDNFSNALYINSLSKNIKSILKNIKQNNYDKIIFENYFVCLKDFIKKSNIDTKVLWTKGLATLNDEFELTELLEIIDMLKNNKIKALGFTEDNLYETYKSLDNVYSVKLTVKQKIKSYKGNKGITILGGPYEWTCNYFNQLSAIKMTNKELVLDKEINIVKRFNKLFDIKNNINEISVASAVYFSSYNNLEIINSFNSGVPVLLGNNTLFFKNTKIEDKIIVKSDDDVEEICNKLNYLYENGKEIIDEYKKIKEEYDKKSEESIKDFIEV